MPRILNGRVTDLKRLMEIESDICGHKIPAGKTNHNLNYEIIGQFLHLLL